MSRLAKTAAMAALLALVLSGSASPLIAGVGEQGHPYTISRLNSDVVQGVGRYGYHNTIANLSRSTSVLDVRSGQVGAIQTSASGATSFLDYAEQGLVRLLSFLALGFSH